MNKIGCVVSAYKIPQKTIETFIIANSHPSIDICVVTKEGQEVRLPSSIHKVEVNFETKDKEVFNIGAASNAGIKKLIENGCDIIIKTDIDNVLSSEMIEQCRGCSSGFGFSYRHHNALDIKDLHNATVDPKCMGTICLSSIDWTKLEAFDERLEGYGADDWHMFNRAKLSGVKIKVLSEPKVYHLSHEGKHNSKTINPINRIYNRKVMEKGMDWIDFKKGEV